MSLLDGDIATLFADVFGGIYLDGVLDRRALVDDGEGGYSKSFTSEACKVQVDACTERQKLEEGYSPKDVRLLVLAGVSDVKAGDRVAASGKTWSVGPTVTQDPARSYFECRGISV